ncbi:uncharacterized protein DUF494 [Hydrogenispora ethanolica]|uniref:Uncharacterized protein DUF494 n=1 Tax=Hydrogenispora ethanolica TaxID=1082276 RepID=A0A4R1QSM8_HYDET|nr:DUF494 family protein [Hydrogenispora ethanolica]TCL56487.1 uncharacterized protein DUF494 [Hydrogenispora ethanolica]
MERVIEIANYVMKQVLDQGDNMLSERNLIAALVELGYEANEIEAAFKLLYSIPSTLKSDDDVIERVSVNGYRVFSPAEIRKISVPCRGELIRLADSSLISPDEMEKILAEALLLDSFEVGMKELELILHKVIEDEERLLMILFHPNDSAACICLN